MLATDFRHSHWQALPRSDTDVILSIAIKGHCEKILLHLPITLLFSMRFHFSLALLALRLITWQSNLLSFNFVFFYTFFLASLGSFDLEIQNLNYLLITISATCCSGVPILSSCGVFVQESVGLCVFGDLYLLERIQI